jgi:radical SAM superfamily enzyme YgiQ (UPF0313 family)
LGIALLIAVLKKHNHEVSLYDLNIQFQNRHKEEGLWRFEKDISWVNERSISRFIEDNGALIDSFVEQILADDPETVGFSICYTTKKLSLELSRRIKRKDRSKIIIFGGQEYFPEGLVRELIKDEAVDVVVMGEGEHTLPELLKKIKNGKNMDFCPGVTFKKSGEIINYGLRNPIMELDTLPFSLVLEGIK